MKRFLVIVLLPIVFLFFGCSISSIMKLAPSKPLPYAISCRENERIIVQVNKMESPIVFDMEETKMTSPGLDIPVFNTFSFNYPYTYTYTYQTWINVIPPKYEKEDYGPKFKAQLDTTFSCLDSHKLLLSLIEKNFNSRSSCPMVYRTSNDLKPFSFLPTDRVIQVVMADYYYGRRPKLVSKIIWRLLTNTANIPLIENKEQELKTMAATLNESMAARRSISYMKQFIQKYNEILSYYDSYATIVYDSPAHSRDAWFEDNGRLAKQETEKALDELTRQLAIALFPGEKGKEDEAIAQRSSSPSTTLPTSSQPLQPQEPTESAGDERGIISITTDPPGAKVFIDGEYKGQTPAEISLATGTYQLFLQRQLYEPYNESLMIEKGQAKTLNIRLSPAGKEQE